MTEDILNTINKIHKDAKENNTDYFCVSRDIFQARLDTFIARTNEYLISAIIGEIGSNTFDHNWEYKEGFPRGVYFNTDDSKTIILADYGRGIRNSLFSVKQCDSDLDALKVAFTEQISGRAPEQRGNGLKFVLESVKQKKWYLYFQSGNASCIIDNGIINFRKEDFSFDGCLAILKTGVQ